ncbi:hypothetical protein LC608_27970 [Nostoc sp. XA010]|uniref:hypothetical protein n=1 Tax=Nostoc sp. XA010 TaxID=2780407 RepID=UPI001E5C9022|nr:hypothetical protein [Nostoc sp. XA010]MCC5660743.1 hypothetical protein [Nostoc sp. XA010]
MFSYSSPAIATYLNIASPVAACVNGSKVAVINTEGVWEVEADGRKKLIPNSYQDARDCVAIDGKTYVLAVPTGLVKIKTDGTTQKIVNSPVSSRTKVKFLDGLIVHQSVNTLSIYDTSLNFKAKRSFEVTEVMDFEYKNKYLYVSGFQQQKRSGIPVQIAFLYRMGFNGTSIFGLPNLLEKNQGKLWGYSPASLVDNMADTRLNKLHISGDKLYVLGSVYGGNSIFRWNGKDLLTETLITTDKYTNAAQTRDETKVYTGVVDLTSFSVERGQLSITRLPSTGGLGDGNSNFPKTIYSNGTDIFVGSSAAYAIPNRDSQTFLGKLIPPYRGDASFLVFPNNLKSRKAWITPGNGEVLLFNSKFAVIKTGKVNDLSTNSGIPQSLPTNTYFIKF